MDRLSLHLCLDWLLLRLQQHCQILHLTILSGEVRNEASGQELQEAGWLRILTNPKQSDRTSYLVEFLDIQ